MKIENNGPKLTSINIEELEANIGIMLPDDYRYFLLNYNGGTPAQEENVIDIFGAPRSPTDVQVFFGINRSVTSSNIIWNVDFIRECYADENLLPIACDSGGGIFFLRRSDSKYEVVYRDMESLDCACYVVAPSFNEFLEKLRSF